RLRRFAPVAGALHRAARAAADRGPRPGDRAAADAVPRRATDPERGHAPGPDAGDGPDSPDGGGPGAGGPGYGRAGRVRSVRRPRAAWFLAPRGQGARRAG